MKSDRFSTDRYPAYKDSGIEWFHEVPKHWSLSRVKSLTKTKSGTTPQSGLSQYYDNGAYFWVRTTDLNNNKLYSSEFKVTDLALEHYNLTFIPIKSVLLAMYGGMGTIGKNVILEEKVTINLSVLYSQMIKDLFRNTCVTTYNILDLIGKFLLIVPEKIPTLIKKQSKDYGLLFLLSPNKNQSPIISIPKLHRSIERLTSSPKKPPSTATSNSLSSTKP